MPFGIWDPVPSGQPSLNGTEQLLDRERIHVEVAADAHLQKSVVYKGLEVILVPQPSDDPNDPLLWPRWQKEVAFWIIFLNSIIFAILPGPILAPATFMLAGVFDVPLTKIAELSGYQLLVVGACGPFVSVFAQKYGKRPQLLFAGAAATIGTAICLAGAQRGNYSTLLAGRIVQGFGVTAWESLPVATAGDLFYLHERGLRTSVLVAALACSASFVSVIAGAMTEGVGFANLFVALLPIDVTCLLLTFFLLPETQYTRVPGPLVAGLGDGDGKLDTTAEKPAVEGQEERLENLAGTASLGSSPAATRQTYAQRLRPYAGKTYTDENLGRLLLAVAAHLINPAVWWILLVSGVLIATFVVTAYILSQIWSVPPYGLGVAANGFFYVGAFLGGVAAVGAGPLCDWTARAFSRRHGGVFEAEFRIPVNVLGALACGLGWFLFSWDVDHPTPHGYYLGAFCYGLACFGISVPSTSAGLYILDSFPRHATEIFILQMMLKNFLFYGFSNFINTWTADAGPGVVFRVFGITSLALLATCFPMYVFGKANRWFMHNVYQKVSIFRSMD